MVWDEAGRWVMVRWRLHRRARAGQGWPGAQASVPTAVTIAGPTAVAYKSAVSPPLDRPWTPVTCTASESLLGSSQRNPGSSTMWTVDPTWVVAAQGSIRDVTTTSGLVTTPQDRATGSVVVAALVVEVLVLGLPDGGTCVVAHAANRATEAANVNSPRRRPRAVRNVTPTAPVKHPTASRARSWQPVGGVSRPGGFLGADTLDWHFASAVGIVRCGLLSPL